MGRSVLSLRDRAREGCLLESRTRGYPLHTTASDALLTATNDAIARVEAAVRRSVDAGGPNSDAIWNRTGGSERYDRRLHRWTDHHDQFAAALL